MMNVKKILNLTKHIQHKRHNKFKGALVMK